MGAESRVIITADPTQAIRGFNRLRTESTASLRDIAAYSDKVSAAMAAIGLTTGLAGIVSLSDEYAKYTAQLRLATISQREYNAAYDDVKRIANAAQQSLAGTGTLYARIANGTRELGVTQKQVAEITETVNLALLVSGATATESASAQLQLSQAFASGTLRGEEFNAVNEAAPRLMKALADGMGRPIGALKQMAGEGQITSKIMADVLPKALADLREEGKKIATIGGALTVLKNEFMEFTAIKAQANGTVSLLTGSIKLLSDNLNVLFAATAGLMTAKLSGYFFSAALAVKAYFDRNAELAALVTAEKAALVAKAQALVSTTAAVAAGTAATLAAAQATLAEATAQKSALLAARELIFVRYNEAKANISSAEAAIAASSAAGALSYALRVNRASTLDLAVAEQARVAALAELTASSMALGRVSAQLVAATESVAAAQTADAAATRANAAAKLGLTGAMGRTAITASVGARALGLLGGPIGAITTLLSIGASAWVLWSGRAKEESAKAAEAVVETTAEAIERLDKEIAKLRERNALRNEVPLVKKLSDPDADVLANAKKNMEDATNAVGRFSLRSPAQLEKLIVRLTNEYQSLLKRFTDKQQGKAIEALGKREDRIKDYLGKNGTPQQRMQADLDEERAKFDGDLPKEIEQTIRAKYEDKGAAAGMKREQSAYENLIAAIRTKTAENALEAKTGQDASESQKMRIKLDELSLVEKKKLSAAHLQSAKDALDELKASEDRLKAAEQEKTVRDALAESANARNASTAALAAEYALYGKSADARDIEMIAVKAAADQEKSLMEAKLKGRIVTGEQIKALTEERDARVLVEQATLAQTKALNYAAGLKLDNQKFAAESLADPKARADALLKIDADVWRERIQLAGAGTEAQKLLQSEFNTWYANQSTKVLLDVDVTRATEVLKILESIDAAARSAASGMADSFGRVGEAIGGLTTSLTGYAAQQQAIAAQLASATSDAKGDPTKIAKAQQLAAQQGAQAQVKSYGDMASAAKGFFKENSAGYKVMQTTEKAFRAYEMALAVESMVKKIFFKETEVAANLALNTTKLTGEVTTSAASTGLAATEASAWGITAVVKALASLPFPANLAAGAATLAAVVAIGAKLMGGMGGGSVSLSEQRQAATGTGTVLGDSSAKSESIAHSLAIMEKNSGLGLAYSASMASSLRQVVAGIGGLGGLLVRNAGVTGSVAPDSYGAAQNLFNSTLGKIPLIGGILGKVGGGVLGSIFGGKTTTLDTGLTLSKATLDSIAGRGVSSSQYTDTKTSGGWFSSDKNSTALNGLGPEANDQFTKIILGLRDTVQSSATALGIGGDAFNARLKTFVVDLGKISLKDLKGEEIQKALEAAFSKLGDDMASFGVAGLEQYQTVGEGYLETLARVANDYMQVSDVLAVLGKSFNTTGLGAVALSESLIAAAGGLDKLTSGTGFFVENFLTEAERMAPITQSVNEAMGKLGQSGVTTVDQFKALVLAQDLNTAAGQAMYAQLIAIAEPFKKAADYAAELAAATGDFAAVAKTASEVASERRDLQQQLNELTKSETQLLAIQRAGIADVNRALFDQVQAAKAVVSAKDALAKAYDTESAAAKTALDKSKSWVTTLNGLNASMALGSQSTLTPEQKYAEARAQFEKTLAAANAGDTTAQSGLSAAEQAFLAASQVVNASDAKYVADYARVMAANDEALKWAGLQVDVQQASLDALTAQVSGLIAINDSVLTVAQAIANLQAAMGTATGLGVRFDGSHAGGLASVPFDGYAAELHRGEVVVDAPAAAAMRRYFGGAPSQGGGNTDALVAEIKSLREEVKGLRADQDKQTGAAIRATVESSDKAAKSVVAGIDKSTKASAWAKQPEYE